MKYFIPKDGDVWVNKKTKHKYLVLSVFGEKVTYQCYNCCCNQEDLHEEDELSVKEFIQDYRFIESYENNKKGAELVGFWCWANFNENDEPFIPILVDSYCEISKHYYDVMGDGYKVAREMTLEEIMQFKNFIKK
jgi:hypothetical protein